MSEVLSPSSSSSLLAAARNRDQEAWRRLSALYGPTVYSWCRRAGLQPADAADILQQVFASVAAGLAHAQWDRPGDSFHGWLWTIFHSRLMDFYRDRRRQPQAVGDTGVRQISDQQAHERPPASSISEPDETASLMRRALAIIKADFNPKTWQAFWRSAVDDQPTSEIARTLGLSPAAVCMCRSRVLRRLRETLAGLGVTADE